MAQAGSVEKVKSGSSDLGEEVLTHTTARCKLYWAVSIIIVSTISFIAKTLVSALCPSLAFQQGY